MGRASIKSNDAIPLPHDGPLQVLLQRSNDAGSLGGHGDFVTKTALEVLQSSVATESSPTILVLLASLRTAKTIKEQLQTLQAFRNKSLQEQKRQHQQQLAAVKEVPDDESETSRLYPVLLYRVLLEGFLSLHTPIPLRRAIQANLDGIYAAAQDSSQFREIGIHVLRSILVPADKVPSPFWHHPLHSVHEALNYKSTHDFLLDHPQNDNQLLEALLLFLQDYAKQKLRPVLDPVMMPSKEEDETTALELVDQTVTTAMEQCIQWAGILKTVLADTPPSMLVGAMVGSDSRVDDSKDCSILYHFESFLLQIMTCRITPEDSLSNLGMAYSRVLLVQSTVLLPKLEENDDSTEWSMATKVTDIVEKKLPNLVAIAMIQGLAATTPIEVMLQESQCLLQYFRQQSNHADPGVRLAALRGIHTLISRCLTRVTGSSSVRASQVEPIRNLTDGTLEIVLQAWENPPNRRLGNAIPQLFEKLVSLMQELGQASRGQEPDKDGSLQPDGPFRHLLMQLLGQPTNRKGRYKALETLLPIVGARQVISLGGRWRLLETLLEGIGDRNSHSAGVIADLWGKILTDLLMDMLFDEMSGDGDDVATSNKTKNIKAFPPELVHQVLPLWWDVWVPSLAAALLSTTPSRRKHVASFCLPRLVAMVGGRKMRKEASSTFGSLLQTIQLHARSGEGVETNGSHIFGSVADRELWATMEVSNVCSLLYLEAITAILNRAFSLSCATVGHQACPQRETCGCDS
jgi:hypothetical protein